MTDQVKDFEKLMALDEKDVVRVYSGKPGCGCGCRGRYFEDERNVRRVVRWMKREAVRTAMTGGRVGVDDGIAFVETDSRYLWAYTEVM